MRRVRSALLVAALVAGAVGITGCVGRTSGNDTVKQPGEKNPARDGPPYPEPS